MELKIVSKGKEYTVLYDDEDHELVSQHHWFLQGEGYVFGYVKGCRPRSSIGKDVLMHRLILGMSQGDRTQTDHINHNRLDNRRCNLRACTYLENNYNISSRPGSSSKYVGVSFNKRCQKWEAWVTIDGRKKNLGKFIDEKEAARVRDKEARKYYGDFACLNLQEA